MSEGYRPNTEEELDGLRKEMEEFKKEKERVRAIVGRIGGVPIFRKKVFEVTFLISVVVLFILSAIAAKYLSGTAHWVFIDVAVAAISLKLIYMMRNQAKVSHFQLWVLTSLEWRLNELTKKLEEMKKD
jgi:hypothetical protein